MSERDPDAYFLADEDRAGYVMPDPRPGEDDTDTVPERECCGGPPWCGCDLYDASGIDPESGPWGGTFCSKHDGGWV